MLAIQLLVIVVVIAGGSLLVLWRFPKAWKSLKLAAIATVWGLGLLLATYFWAFDGSNCSDTLSVTCRVNENQGVLTLLTILLAVLAVWATLLTREIDEREKGRAEQGNLEAAVAEAFHEATHNLIHVAQAFDQDKKLRKLPQTSRLAVARLLQPDMATKLPRRYKLSADAVYRTWELLQALSWTDSFGQNVPAAVKNYTRACLLLLKDSVNVYPDCSGDPNDDRYGRDFWRLREKHVHIYFSSSDGRRDVAHLRADEVPLLCWWADTDIEGVTIIEEGRRFKDLYAQGR